MVPQSRHTCLHLRHTSRSEPQTSQLSFDSFAIGPAAQATGDGTAGAASRGSASTCAAVSSGSGGSARIALGTT